MEWQLRLGNDFEKELQTFLDKNYTKEVYCIKVTANIYKTVKKIGKMVLNFIQFMKRKL